MNAPQALSLVEQGYAQPGWRVTYIRTGHLVGRIFGGAFGLVVCAFGVAIASFVAFGAFGAFGDVSGFGGFGGIGSLIASLVFIGFLVGGVFSIAWLISGILILLRPKAKRPVLILAPDGVVERGGFWGTRVRAISYADIVNARLRVTTNTTYNAQTGASSTTVSHALILTHLNGRKETWSLDGAFGRPDAVASDIITAQIQYAALHGVQRP